MLRISYSKIRMYNVSTYTWIELYIYLYIHKLSSRYVPNAHIYVYTEELLSITKYISDKDVKL